MLGPDFDIVLAYGPGPPVDLIPYFLALLGWVGLAFAALLMSPLNALLRLLRRLRGAPPAVNKSKPLPASAPEAAEEKIHDRS